MFGNFSLFKTPFLGWNSIPPSFVSFFVFFYIFFLPLFEDLGCFSGCLMSSASIQKLFCGIYSTFKCSFDEFVGEKVFSPSYSSAILAPPPGFCFLISGVFFFLCGCAGSSCCVRAFSSCSKWGPLLLSECKPVIARASHIIEHFLNYCSLNKVLHISRKGPQSILVWLA